MLKFVLSVMFLLSSLNAESEYGYVNGHKYTFIKGFWCAAAAGDETIDIPVLVLRDDLKQKLIVFPKEAFNLENNISASEVKDALKNNAKFYSVDTDFKLDQLECDNASLKQLQVLNHKK